MGIDLVPGSLDILISGGIVGLGLGVPGAEVVKDFLLRFEFLVWIGVGQMIQRVVQCRSFILS